MILSGKYSLKKMQAEKNTSYFFPHCRYTYIENKWGPKTREQQFPRVLEKEKKMSSWVFLSQHDRGRADPPLL